MKSLLYSVSNGKVTPVAIKYGTSKSNVYKVLELDDKYRGNNELTRLLDYMVRLGYMEREEVKTDKGYYTRASSQGLEQLEVLIGIAKTRKENLLNKHIEGFVQADAFCTKKIQEFIKNNPRGTLQEQKWKFLIYMLHNELRVLYRYLFDILQAFTQGDYQKVKKLIDKYQYTQEGNITHIQNTTNLTDKQYQNYIIMVLLEHTRGGTPQEYETIYDSISHLENTDCHTALEASKLYHLPRYLTQESYSHSFGFDCDIDDTPKYLNTILAWVYKGEGPKHMQICCSVEEKRHTTFGVTVSGGVLVGGTTDMFSIKEFDGSRSIPFYYLDNYAITINANHQRHNWGTTEFIVEPEKVDYIWYKSSEITTPLDKTILTELKKLAQYYNIPLKGL